MIKNKFLLSLAYAASSSADSSNAFIVLPATTAKRGKPNPVPIENTIPKKRSRKSYLLLKR